MEISFSRDAAEDRGVADTVREFLKNTATLEKTDNAPIVVFQDGVRQSYYIRCALS